MIDFSPSLWATVGVVGLAAAAAWAGVLGYGRTRRERALLAGSIRGMTAQLHSEKAAPVIGLVGELARLLAEQDAATRRIERAVRNGYGLPAVHEALRGLASIGSPAAAVHDFVVTRLDPVERETALDHLHEAARATIEWSREPTTVDPAWGLADETLVGGVAAVVDALASTGPGRPVRGADLADLAERANDQPDAERAVVLDVVGSAPRLDELAELRATCEQFHRTLTFELSLGQAILARAERAGYSDRGALDDLAAAFATSADALARAGAELTDGAAIASLLLLVDSRIPVPENGVPGERTRVALLDQVPWLLAIATAHRALVVAWTATATGEHGRRRAGGQLADTAARRELGRG